MTKTQLIAALNGDLANEYKHWHFYVNAAVRVRGLHREEIKEFLLKQAASEMAHVGQFADLIVGLGGVPVCMPREFSADLTDPYSILKYAMEMEDEVIENYFVRMAQAEELGTAEGRWVVVFLEDQMIDSRTDRDHLSQMIQ